MVVQTFVDAFNITTAVGGTTLPRTGYGFAPQAAIVWCSGRSESTDTVGGQTYQWSLGFAVSPTLRGASAMHSEDAAATSDADADITSAGCVLTLGAAAAAEGRLDIQSVDAGGYTFIIDDAFARDIRSHVWAISGITAASAESFNSPTTPSQVDYVVNGAFPPSIIFFLMRGGTAPGARHSFGYAMSAANQAVVSFRARDNVTTMDTVRYGRSGMCMAPPATATATLLLQAELVQMNADGFRLNWTTVEGSARNFAILAIQGGNWVAGTNTTKTNTTPFTLTTTGITPAGLLVVSHGTAESASATPVANAHISVGAAASATNRGAHACSDQTGLADAETATLVEHDAIYGRLDFADGRAGLMDVSSAFSAGAAELVMDDADPDEAWFWWAAPGNPVATAVGPLEGGHLVHRGILQGRLVA